MGLLDISPTDALSGALSGTGDAISGNLAEVAGVAVASGAVASGATIGGVLLPTIAGVYADAAAEELIGRTHTRVSKISENLNEDTTSDAIAKKAADGFCRLLDPCVADQNLEELAANDPKQLNRVLQQVLDADDAERQQLERIEQTLSAVLMGQEPPEDVELGFDPTNTQELLNALTDIFDTQDKNEALHMLLVYEQFLSDVADDVEATDADALPESLEGLDEELSAAVTEFRARFDDLVDVLVTAQIENQGFEVLSPWKVYKKEPFPHEGPIRAWITGFKWPELVATTDDGDPYYFDRTLPPDHDLRRYATTEDSSVVEAVTHALKEGQNLALNGTPGLGKSHICKRVALEWFDDRVGEVFYREGTEDQPFDDDAELIQAIKDAQTEGDGHVLVVVEDAPREASRKIFDTMDEFRNAPENVSFLLDSRAAIWERYADSLDAPRFVRMEAEDGESHPFLETYDIPSVTETDCANAIEVFNATTVGRYNGTAGWLFDRVTGGQSVRGEVLVLASELIEQSHLEREVPLAQSAGSVHEELLTRVDSGGKDAPLYYRLAIGIATLAAAEIGVEPALLYAVGRDASEKETIYEMLHRPEQTNESPPVDLNGVIVFPEDKSAGPYRVRHGEWYRRFFESQLDRDRTPPDVDVRVQETFLYVVTQFVSLADDTAERELIGDGLRSPNLNGRAETPYLDRFTAEPAEVATELLTRLYEFGEENPDLVALFYREGFGTTEQLADPERIPEVCSTTLHFRLRLRRAEILKRLRTDDDRHVDVNRGVKRDVEELSEPQRTELQAVADRQLAEWDVARFDTDELYGAAIEGFETAGKRHEAAQLQLKRARAASGTFGAGWDDIERHYRAAIETFEGIDADEAAAEAREKLARNSDVIDNSWDETDEYYREAIRAYEAIGADMEAARTRGQLARDAAGHGLPWDDIEAYYLAAVDAYADIGAEEKAAKERRQLARTAKDACLQWSKVEAYYLTAVEAFEDINLAHDAAEAREKLASAASDLNRPWSDVEKYYEDAIDVFVSVDERERAAKVRQRLASVALDADRPWSEAEQYYLTAISTLEEINAKNRAAHARRSLASSAENADLPWRDVEGYYQAAIDAFEENHLQRGAARIQEELASAAADAGRPWSDVNQYYKEAIDAYDAIGDDQGAAHAHEERAREARDADRPWDEVEELYRTAIAAYENADMELSAALAHEGLVSAATDVDLPWDEREAYYKEAIRAYEQINDVEKVIHVRDRLASAAANVGRPWDEVEEHYLATINACEGINQEGKAAGTRRELAAAAADADRPWDDVEEYYLEAIAACEEIDADKEAAVARRMLASAAADADLAWEDVEQYYIAAIEACERIDATDKIAETRRFMTGSAADAGVAWERIRDYCEEAIESSKQVGTQMPLIRARLSAVMAASRADQVSWDTRRDYIQEQVAILRESMRPSHELSTSVFHFLDSVEAVIDRAIDHDDHVTAEALYRLARDMVELSRSSEYLRERLDECHEAIEDED
jgi:hypothetical protein